MILKVGYFSFEQFMIYEYMQELEKVSDSYEEEQLRLAKAKSKYEELKEGRLKKFNNESLLVL